MCRAILQGVPVYLAMGLIQTVKVMIGFLIFSLMLQVVTFTTPGWRVLKNETSGIVEYVALLYDVRCDQEGCGTHLVSEDEAKKDFLFHFITWIIEGMVPILCSSLSLFVLILIILKPRWQEPFILISAWSLGIAMVLQWDLIATFIELHRLSTVGEFKLKGYSFPVPWNVVLHTISAFLTTIVMLASFLILMNRFVVKAMAKDETEEEVVTVIDESEAESII
ncbi:hypothetical protein ACJMK2_008676 [Sinanodonta woodiana]|uniref:Uncharacterized protein n=1 Tax=Sinanodonta woodiana TaxID=1069815 RepID=A0ABD3VQB1_SINWO